MFCRIGAIVVTIAVAGCMPLGVPFPQLAQPVASDEAPTPTPEEIARQRQAWADQDRAQAAWQEVLRKAESHGYKRIASFNDLILDGKQLANDNAKIMLTTFYKKEGATEYIYPTQYDAYQGTNGFPILTEDAQRPLRAYFMSPECSQSPMGCRASIGGHMTMCKHLSILLADYPLQPCLNVEVVIQ